ncbi:MAG: HlyD family secretion protein [Alphaproteobacteria bacterium]|nr:HlyD family secretion protein [Alphaproteobacteria bacterium]
MTLERDSREIGDETLLEAPRSEAARARGKSEPYRPSADEVNRPRAPTPRERPIEDEEERDPEEPRGAGEARKGWLRRHPIAVAFGLLCLLLALPAGYLYWDYTSHFETTDDAYIASRQFGIAPEVSGYIRAVPVTDNEHVKAGQVIARIDDRTYRAALAQTEAQVAAAQANIENIDAQMNVQQAQIAADQAQVNQQQAALVFAQEQAARYQYLAHTIAGTVQNAQQYTSQMHQQQASLDSAQATLKLAQRQVEALKAQRDSAVASLAQAKAQREQAQLNLSYTTVTADQPGHVVQLSAGVGQYAQSGTNLTMFVPDDIWIWANFKETQLDKMRPRQPVTVDIDAYPERTIHGHIVSVQPGSGTAFSLLPAQNATGNWVKIVQRVPVKVVLNHLPTDVALGPGMSAEVGVRVNSHPSLYEQLRRWL